MNRDGVHELASDDTCVTDWARWSVQGSDTSSDLALPPLPPKDRVWREHGRILRTLSNGHVESFSAHPMHLGIVGPAYVLRVRSDVLVVQTRSHTCVRRCASMTSPPPDAMYCASLELSSSSRGRCSSLHGTVGEWGFGTFVAQRLNVSRPSSAIPLVGGYNMQTALVTWPDGSQCVFYPCDYAPFPPFGAFALGSPFTVPEEDDPDGEATRSFMRLWIRGQCLDARAAQAALAFSSPLNSASLEDLGCPPRAVSDLARIAADAFVFAIYLCPPVYIRLTPQRGFAMHTWIPRLAGELLMRFEGDAFSGLSDMWSEVSSHPGWSAEDAVVAFDIMRHYCIDVESNFDTPSTFMQPLRLARDSGVLERPLVRPSLFINEPSTSRATAFFAQPITRSGLRVFGDDTVDSKLLTHCVSADAADTRASHLAYNTGATGGLLGVASEPLYRCSFTNSACRVEACDGAKFLRFNGDGVHIRDDSDTSASVLSQMSLEVHDEVTVCYSNTDGCACLAVLTGAGVVRVEPLLSSAFANEDTDVELPAPCHHAWPAADHHRDRDRRPPSITRASSVVGFGRDVCIVDSGVLFSLTASGALEFDVASTTCDTLCVAVCASGLLSFLPSGGMVSCVRGAGASSSANEFSIRLDRAWPPPNSNTISPDDPPRQGLVFPCPSISDYLRAFNERDNASGQALFSCACVGGDGVVVATSGKVWVLHVSDTSRDASVVQELGTTPCASPSLSVARLAATENFTRLQCIAVPCVGSRGTAWVAYTPDVLVQDFRPWDRLEDAVVVQRRSSRGRSHGTPSSKRGRHESRSSLSGGSRPLMVSEDLVACAFNDEPRARDRTLIATLTVQCIVIESLRACDLFVVQKVPCADGVPLADVVWWNNVQDNEMFVMVCDAAGNVTAGRVQLREGHVAGVSWLARFVHSAAPCEPPPPRGTPPGAAQWTVRGARVVRVKGETYEIDIELCTPRSATADDTAPARSSAPSDATLLLPDSVHVMAVRQLGGMWRADPSVPSVPSGPSVPGVTHLDPLKANDQHPGDGGPASTLAYALKMARPPGPAAFLPFPLLPKDAMAVAGGVAGMQASANMGTGTGVEMEGVVFHPVHPTFLTVSSQIAPQSPLFWQDALEGAGGRVR